jgi:quinol-cytochrome oxidoreductase complex cytochrome b subunit
VVNADVLRFLLLPAIVVAAWLISSRYPERARQAARLFGVILAVGFLATTATGLERLTNPDSTHRWFGHGSLIVAWLAAPFAIGVILQRRIRQRPISAIFQTFMILAAVGLNLLGGFTGYLGPSTQPNVETGDTRLVEETINRFYVMHTVVLPCLYFAFVGIWISIFRPERELKETTEKS